jgi:hypothetical protein
MSKIDTASGALDAMQDALVTLEPPAHVTLRHDAWPFWHSIVKTRPASAWTAPDLEIAAHLARAKADIERVQQDLYKEGDIVTNTRGTQIANPRHQILETLTRRAVALSRMLHVHAEATGGKARKEKPRNRAQAEAGEAVDGLDDDDLIPGAGAH